MAKEKEDVTLAEVLDRLARIQEANNSVQKEQLKQTARRTNTLAPLISVFNPQGQKDYPMPRLKCEVEIAFPMTPELHGLTWEETELINLLEPCETQIELNDGSTIAVCVVGQMNTITKQWEKLALRGQKDPETGKYAALFTHSNKQQFPALRTLLRQILGDRAAGVLTMEERKRRTKLWQDVYTADGKDAADTTPNALPCSIGA